MKKIKLTLLLATLFILAACSGNNASEDNQKDENVKSLVNEYSAGNFGDESASITGTELIITETDETEKVYPLPTDEFFVSFAPFETFTHPCTNHSLTGCQGELVDKEIDFTIEDSDGNTVVADTYHSGKNGFVDFWLPRDKTYTVKVQLDGKTSEETISTFEDDATCVTTMQLM